MGLAAMIVLLVLLLFVDSFDIVYSLIITMMEHKQSSTSENCVTKMKYYDNANPTLFDDDYSHARVMASSSLILPSNSTSVMNGDSKK